MDVTLKDIYVKKKILGARATLQWLRSLSCLQPTWSQYLAPTIVIGVPISDP